MWLENLKELSINKSRYVNIITRNSSVELNDLEELKEPKFVLNHKECEEFLANKSKDIEILKVQDDKKADNLNVECFQLNLEHFGNLKKLVFHQMSVTNEDLQVISANCLQLRSLLLIKCFCEHFQTLIPGVNLNIDHICDMLELQELEIQPERPPGSIRELQLIYVEQLLSSLLKLKALRLKNFTVICEESEKEDKTFIPPNIWHLESFHVGTISYDFWCTFTGYIKACPLLRDLTISSYCGEIVINIKVIDILRKYCKDLKCLHLENCDIDVEDFSPLHGLQEITLSCCTGLTFNNLQQILGGLKLKNFKLFNTRVYDCHNYIYISPTIESITIDSICSTEISEMFQRSLNSFNGLQTLNWFNGDIHHDWIRDKCPHLKQLYILNPYHLSRMIFALKSLRELTFASSNGLSWRLLKMLVSKLCLRRLTIYTSYAIIEDKRSSQDTFKVKTTLEFLTIPFEIFLRGFKYWLDLLDVNDQLGFLIYGTADNLLNVNFLSFILAVESVRKRWKRIKVCGFNLDLENFENSTILKEIAYLHMNTNHYRARNIPFTLEL